jgi:tetratricopeptide (TPR) repeat protein
MKKLVFACVVALASAGFVAGPTLHAQDQGGQITIKDPAEYNAYQMFSTQTDPKQKIAAGDAFLEKYPQSVVKNAVLDSLLDAYQATGNPEKVLDTANKLLQVDPNSMKAILYSVMIKKGQCGQKSDPATCDDAAALAQKGLQVQKPASTSDEDWKKMTGVAYPIFHSAIGLDDAISKKDFKGAQEEYTAEIKLFSDEQSKSQGLVDTLQLAQAYSQPGATQDLPKAIYLYARVWAFAPPQYKGRSNRSSSITTRSTMATSRDWTRSSRMPRRPPSLPAP